MFSPLLCGFVIAHTRELISASRFRQEELTDRETQPRCSGGDVDAGDDLCRDQKDTRIGRFDINLYANNQKIAEIIHYGVVITDVGVGGG